VVVSLCLVTGMGHAWSGGAKSLPFSDPTGPDAAALIWAFVQRQFAR
jgi:poly(3-hydroxybutyrate) depolymerase